MIELFSAEALTALATLTAMEIILGIDNIVFLAILVGRVEPAQQNKTRNIGLTLALIMRIGLLLSISWVMQLTEPLFALMTHAFSGRDLILLGGGLFLMAKSTLEIHHKVEGESDHPQSKKTHAGVINILLQITVLDIVFSLDSVITAVGMANQLWVMITAMVVAMLVMLAAAKSIGDFVNRHPSVKILALSFLLLIGVMLTMEGMGKHMEKGFIYFAMFFSLLVELLNMRFRYKTRRAHVEKV